MSVKLRQAVEKAIITRFVKDALAAGNRLSVSLERGYDVDEMLLGSRDEQKIIDEAMAGDDAHVFIHEGDGPLTGEPARRAVWQPQSDKSIVSIGWVYFVLGNDGYDVISDYLANEVTESLLKGANELADKIENGDVVIAAS